MFVGEYNHTLDSKGRVSLPAKFRSFFESGAVITKGIDHCLFVYTRAEWDKLASKVANLPVSQSNNRAFSRLMLAGAWEVQLDKQNRVVVPDHLRTYASLKKETVVIGLYNRMEIWDKAEWERYKLGTDASGSDIAEALGTIGV
ncbi:MAG: division/cell wall cluster transcriptional repressor MraZ [bacterium]